MCIIIAKDKGQKLPPIKHFKNSEERNSDGVGVAICKKNETKSNIIKNFKDYKECYKYLIDNTNEEDIVLIHFRFSTSGLITEQYRHPYPVTDNICDLKSVEISSDIVVCHNGVLLQYDYKNVVTNDTMNFIREILADKAVRNNLTSPIIQKLIQEHISSDKLAFIVNGEMILIGEFEEEDGVFYSNSGYADSMYSFPSEDTMLIEECENCYQDKKLKNVTINGEEFVLCKNCRRAYGKGKLTYEEIKYVTSF